MERRGALDPGSLDVILTVAVRGVVAWTREKNWCIVQ